jgi:hypothetical protein
LAAVFHFSANVCIFNFGLEFVYIYMYLNAWCTYTNIIIKPVYNYQCYYRKE